MHINKFLYTIILTSLISICLSDDIPGSNIYYLEPGPNLVSFNVLPENTSVNDIFSSIQDKLVSIISEGQISYNSNGDWAGTLTNLDYGKGYWITTSDISLINITGTVNNDNTYYLETGANLISYPFTSIQSVNEALPFYTYYNVQAIIGENQAALISGNQIFGSLTHFEPNKGYWFLVTEPTLFEYNNSIESSNEIINTTIVNDLDIDIVYNQSTAQSVFFIEEAYSSGNSLTNNDQLFIECNNTIVGGKQWNGEMTDLIAMGNDGNPYSDNYCQNLQDITIKVENNNSQITDLHIIGNKQWNNNDISIISLSDFKSADVNFDNNINVTDIIIIIEHITSNNLMTNSQQLLLSDINNDQNINITDIIIIIDSIIE
tara:strand:+ start:177 stop:1304 length:1128 start_codon:yes stop_codon:yes gene_type:complete